MEKSLAEVNKIYDNEILKDSVKERVKTIRLTMLWSAIKKRDEFADRILRLKNATGPCPINKLRVLRARCRRDLQRPAQSRATNEDI